MRYVPTFIIILGGFLATAAQAQDALSGQEPTAVFLQKGAPSVVPLDEIRPGGPPVDGIPALSRPKRIHASEADTFLAPEDTVLGLVIEKEAVAYPIRLLNWHEIINDTVGSVAVAVTYCPLRHSARVFERRLDMSIVEFGVSGLLYRGALVMYDRRTKSLWSQIIGKSIVGSARGDVLKRRPAALATWNEWRTAHPDTLVASFDTGYARDYEKDPYAR